MTETGLFRSMRACGLQGLTDISVSSYIIYIMWSQVGGLAAESCEACQGVGPHHDYTVLSYPNHDFCRLPILCI